MKTNLDEIELLRRLCLAFGPSGCEDAVRERITEEIRDCCDELYTDRLGNLIARISPKAPTEKTPRLMLSAHMDEVGFMVTAITEEGYLKFDTVGSIDPGVLCGKNVTVGDETDRKSGLIASKAIHHKSREERLDITKITSMLIDIGAKDREDASQYCSIGSYGTFDSEFYCFGSGEELIKSKALDDRLGCAVLIRVMRAIYEEKPQSMPHLYFCFTVREEVGISGAQVAAQVIQPDYAVVLETTAVADLAEVAPASQVAHLGEGGAISLMDRSTIYDRAFVDAALGLARAHDIPVQIKQFVSGGNDAAHIHKSGVGVRTLALSAPCRYLHSPACVAHRKDYDAMYRLLEQIIRSWHQDMERMMTNV